MIAVRKMCAELSEYWKDVNPGIFTMHITSFHMFVNDREHIIKVVDKLSSNV